MFCSKCGIRQGLEDARYCHKCGARLDTDSGPPPAPLAQPRAPDRQSAAATPRKAVRHIVAIAIAISVAAAGGLAYAALTRGSDSTGSQEKASAPARPTLAASTTTANDKAMSMNEACFTADSTLGDVQEYGTDGLGNIVDMRSRVQQLSVVDTGDTSMDSALGVAADKANAYLDTAVTAPNRNQYLQEVKASRSIIARKCKSRGIEVTGASQEDQSTSDRGDAVVATNDCQGLDLVALQQGEVSGSLAQYGIWTNNPETGEFLGVAGVVDQMWRMWFGSETADMSPEEMSTQLAGGFPGNDLRTLFDSWPGIYERMYNAIMEKAERRGARCP